MKPFARYSFKEVQPVIATIAKMQMIGIAERLIRGGIARTSAGFS